MHIADGMLATPVWAALDAAAVAVVGLASRRAAAANAPMLGVMGAFVFAAQRMNFPVGLGTSGHLLGGALLAMTLGPSAATIVLTYAFGHPPGSLIRRNLVRCRNEANETTGPAQ